MSEKNKGFDAGKAVDQIKGDRNLMIVALGAVAIVVGLFLPWYSVKFLGISTSASPGFDSPGIFLIVLSVVAIGAALNVLNMDKKQMGIVTIVAGIIAVLVMLNNWPDSELGDAVSTGIGYWLSFAGAIAMVVGGVMYRQAGGSKHKK